MEKLWSGYNVEEKNLFLIKGENKQNLFLTTLIKKKGKVSIFTYKEMLILQYYNFLLIITVFYSPKTLEEKTVTVAMKILSSDLCSFKFHVTTILCARHKDTF